jgi:hypothetical protein
MNEQEKGLSYVPQIFKAYDDLVESNRASLSHALKLGQLLIDAKETVGHGNWASWVKTNLASKISERTAQVYMNLAKNKEKFSQSGNAQRAADFMAKGDAKGESKLSIRAAIELVNKKDGGGTGTKRGRGSGRGKGKGASPDLTTLLKNVGSDEIKIALKQSERFDEVAEAITPPLQDQLKAIDAPSLALLLTDTAIWSADKVQALIQELNKRMRSEPAPPTPSLPRLQRPEARA